MTVLSLILCSRNDQYLGNSRWRLETTLNYIGDRVVEMQRESDIEVVVADWGSERPLCDVLELSPAASRIVSFLTVPAQLAHDLQGDSPFPEVLALNAAARRAHGEYIGRIDQDTLVGAGFLTQFLDWAEGAWPREQPLAKTLLFANRRSIPYRFAVRCPPLWAVERLIRQSARKLRIETASVFYVSDVGIWLLHRDLWNESGGYDERMIYMNDMEIDMTARLMTRYPMVDLGKLVDYDFYHLDHYHPRGSRSSGTHRKVNNQAAREPRGFRPSGEAWGLAAYDLGLTRQRGARKAGSPVSQGSPGRALTFARLTLATGMRMMVDRVIYPFIPKWRRRAGLIWAVLSNEPWQQWPHVFRSMLIDRRLRRVS